MHATDSRLAAVVLTVLVLATVSAFPPTIACPRAYTESQLSSNVRQMAEKVDMLWNGTEDERLWIAEDSSPHFRVFDMEEAAQAPEEIDALVASLRLFVQIEPDDWILTGVLRGLAWMGNPKLNAVFADALEHPSRNVRAVAVQRFVRVKSTEAVSPLERMWSEEIDAEIRINTMLALGCQGSDRFARQFIAALDSPHDPWIEAAIQVLGKLAPMDNELRMLRAARSEEASIRGEAFAALGRWPDSERAKRTLLEGLQDDVSWVSDVAINALDSFEGDEVDAAILGRVFGDNPWLRTTAFMAYRARLGIDHEALIERLERDERFRDENLESYENAVDWEKLAADWERDPNTCPFYPVERDPTKSDYLRLVGNESEESVRCHVRPGAAQRPIFADRTPTGSLISVGDSFEHEGEMWWVGRGCWFPESAVEFVDAAAPDSYVEPDGVEFDIAPTDLTDPWLTALLDAEALELFDRTDRLVGVRILADPAAGEILELFVAAYKNSETLFGLRLESWIKRLREIHHDDSVWQSLDDIDQHSRERWRRLLEDAQAALPAYRVR